MPYRPNLERHRVLVSKQLTYSILHESGKYDPKTKAYVAPDEPIICNIVFAENGAIVCSGRGIDDESAFTAAFQQLDTLPVEELKKPQLEMAMELMRLKAQIAQKDADMLAKPTQRRAPTAGVS